MQGNVLILTYWALDDALVQTYSLPYVRIIRRLIPPSSTIHLVTLEKNGSEQGKLLDGKRQSLEQAGIQWLPLRYRPFGIAAMAGWLVDLVRLAYLTIRQPIEVIHCWGTPAGAIGYCLSVVTGRKLVIDSYEPHAESMVENGTWKKNGLAFRLLFALEKWQTRRATVLIAANAGMKDYARNKYGVVVERFLVKPACVDQNLFQPTPEKDGNLLRELGLVDKRTALYAGKLGGIYLDREVFAFLKAAHDRWGDTFRALLLTNHGEDQIASFCAGAQLDRSVVITRFVPHAEVARYLNIADFALTPVKPVPTKRYCTPIKNGEYWAMGLPIVIPPDISDDSSIIKEEGLGSIWETLDAEGYRKSLVELEQLLAIPRVERQHRIRQLAVRYRSFAIADKVYAEVYSR